MKTIEIIEKSTTDSLQLGLKERIIFLEKVDDAIKLFDSDSIYVKSLKEKKEDIEIDLHLIRMELTKRMWKE